MLGTSETSGKQSAMLQTKAILANYPAQNLHATVSANVTQQMVMPLLEQRNTASILNPHNTSPTYQLRNAMVVGLAVAMKSSVM